jgi:hypothetical protein
MSNATAWVFNIGQSSWNQMHMAMHYSLSCSLATVHANVEAKNRLVILLQQASLLCEQRTSCVSSLPTISN